jgi:type I restriction enzyme S subunit
MSDIAALVSDHLDIWTAATERKNGAGRGGGKRVSLYGIEQLRALIFDLAAAGRLDGNINVAPEPLGKHVDLVMGQAPPGSACNTTGVGTVFVKTGEFGPVYPEVREWTTKPLKMAQAGDVLICVVGATIGKLNLAIDCAIGRSVAAIRPKASLDTRYLYFALMPYTLRLRRDARGSAQGVIGKAELNAIAIRVPTVAEQRRIVAKVDELMALCDALERESAAALAAHQTLVETLLATLVNSADAADLAANWSRLEAHFDTLFTTEASVDAFKQTILELAVSGRLVAQDASDESASELLKRVAAEKSQLIRAKAIKKSEVPPITAEETPYSLPSNWQWARLGQIGDWGAGSTPPRGDSYLYGGGITWLKSGELNDNRALAGSEETVTDAAVQSGTFRLNKPGDVLIAMYGATIGKVAILAEPAVTNQAVCGCTPFTGVSNQYLFQFLLSQRDRFHKASEGGAQPNISKVKIIHTLIPVPPSAEQLRIVAKVDALMALCDDLKVRIAGAALTQMRLADAIVERAAA